MRKLSPSSDTGSPSGSVVVHCTTVISRSALPALVSSSSLTKRSSCARKRFSTTLRPPGSSNVAVTRPSSATWPRNCIASGLPFSTNARKKTDGRLALLMHASSGNPGLSAKRGKRGA